MLLPPWSHWPKGSRSAQFNCRSPPRHVDVNVTTRQCFAAPAPFFTLSLPGTCRNRKVCGPVEGAFTGLIEARSIHWHVARTDTQRLTLRPKRLEELAHERIDRRGRRRQLKKKGTWATKAPAVGPAATSYDPPCTHPFLRRGARRVDRKIRPFRLSRSRRPSTGLPDHEKKTDKAAGCHGGVRQAARRARCARREPEVGHGGPCHMACPAAIRGDGNAN